MHMRHGLCFTEGACFEGHWIGLITDDGKGEL
jgi:hypothetical protein